MNFLVHLIHKVYFVKKDIENENISFEIEKIQTEENSEENKDFIINDAFYLVSGDSDDPLDSIIKISEAIEIEDSEEKTKKLSELIASSKEWEEEDHYNQNLFIIKRLINAKEEMPLVDTFSTNFDHAFFLTKKDENDNEYLEYHYLSFYAIEEKQIMKIVEEEDNE